MPPPRRLVRRRPLVQRIKDYLDPSDWLIWLNEELESSEWAEQLQDYATPLGVLANFVFLITRANSGSKPDDSDVFSDFDGRGSGWFAWLSSFLVHFLTLAALANAFATLTKRKHYRLFEKPLDFKLQTPSARRVRVEPSPTANSSPLSFINAAFSPFMPESAESRAHPQEGRDVWEVSVWDPTPLGLKLLCVFSPPHVLIYWMFLPTAPLDPSPSVTYVKTIFLIAVLSSLMAFMRKLFEQQQKDKSIISKEVMHEYDTKFVHPSLNHPVRDVGIQTPPSKKMRHSSAGGKEPATYTDTGVDTNSSPEVVAYTPHTVVNRGFRISPNPDYASQYDPDNLLKREEAPRLPHSNTAPLFTATTPASYRTPLAHPNSATSSAVATAADFSSPLRPVAAQRQQRQKSPVRHSTGTTGGEGGSLGVYSHAASPLRKAASQNFLRGKGNVDRVRREGSPLKRMSTPGDLGGRKRV